MSYNRLSAKPLNSTMSVLLKRASKVGLGMGALTPMLALANPTGGQVTAGQATIATPNANKMVIDQASQSAIINWQQFSIGAGQFVQFLQPSSSSVVLNRVVGGNASSILGSMSANGQVFLINPNGIFFGKSASLDVQGLFASTLNISDSDFLAGNYVFQKGTGASDASVINQGKIQSNANGYVVLAGDYAENDGIISGHMGHVVLASGTQATLSLNGNTLVNFAVDQATLAKFAGVDNTGSLVADGGSVIMTADVANALKATVVNNTGLIEARSISNGNGNIFLTAEGGTLANSGTLDATGEFGAMAGGTITLQGDGLTKLASTSKISTTANGAKGGHIEISGNNLSLRGAATAGQGGSLLLDPNKVKLVTGGASTGKSGGTAAGPSASIGVGFIQTALGAGNVKISAHSAISHSVAATAINTANTGNLSFKVASGGTISLKGMSITLGGNLTASAGGGNANMSFGAINAKAATIAAGTGTVKLAGGTGTVPSLKANGGAVGITAGQLGLDSGNLLYIQDVGGAENIAANIGGASSFFSGAVALSAKSVVDTGFIHNSRNVSVIASNGNMSIGKVITGANDNVTLTDTGGRILDLNIIDAGGNITVTNNTGNINIDHLAAVNNITVTDKGAFHVSSGTAVTGSFVDNNTGNVTIGHVNAAKNVNLTATTGTMKTGAINAYGGAVTVTDTAANMTVGSVHAASNVVLNNLGHTLSFASNGGVHAGHNAAIVGTTIQQTGTNFDIDATGTVNVTGQIALAVNPSSAAHNLFISGAAGVKLDHGVAIPGGVAIVGPSLTYAGTSKTFSLSAGRGNLSLNAAIGSAAAPVAYNVNLMDQGHGIFIQKSIYTGNTVSHAAANITATETGHAPAAVSGVLVGNSYGGAVNLQTAGSVLLTGWNVGVGNVGVPGHGSNFGSINLIAGGGIVLTATGSGESGGGVGVEAARAVTHNGTKNTSILLQAATGIKLVGEQVSVEAGSASASIGDNVLGQALANVTLKAVNVALTGGNNSYGGVDVDAGRAVAKGEAFGGSTNKATANANVVINATGNITLTGNRVEVSGGYGLLAQASAGEGNANMTAIANAQVVMTATNNVTLTGGAAGNGDVRVVSAYRPGSYGGRAVAEGDNVTASAVTHGDVSLTAGNAVNIGANSVNLMVGNSAGRPFVGDKTVAQAIGSHATATYTLTDNLNFTAGAGGVNVTAGGGVEMQGGADVFTSASVEANGTANAATATGTAHLNLTATGTGNIKLLAANNVNIDAGYGVANSARDQGYGTGAATMTVDGSVNLSGANVTIGSAGGHSANVGIGGGSGLNNAYVYADGSVNASLTETARVNITATTGNINVLANQGLDIDAGYGVGIHADVQGYEGGNAALIADGGVSLTGANVTLGVNQATSHDGRIFILGAFAGGSDILNADSGKAALTADSEVVINATTGNLTITGASGINVYAGNGVGAHTNPVTHASDSGSISLSANAGVSLMAHGNVNLTASQGYGSHVIIINGGGGAGSDNNVSGYGDGEATITGLSSVNITAGGSFSAKAGREVSMNAGYGVGAYDRVNGYGSGALAVAGNGSINVNAASIVIQAGSTVRLQGGGSAAYEDALYADVGDATVTGTARVNLTATAGNISLIGNEQMSVDAGSRAAYHASMQGYEGGVASVTGDGGVSLSAANISLGSAGGHSAEVDVLGGNDAGEQDHLRSEWFGSANATGNDVVSINATTGNLTITGAQHIAISGGRSVAGYGAGTNKASGDGAHINLNANTGVNLTAHGNITITGGGPGHSVDIHGGGSAAAANNLLGSSGGVATLNGLSSVNITAGGSFTAKAGNVNIEAGYGVANDAYVYGGSGGKAIYTGNATVAVTAANILVQASSTALVQGGNSAGARAFLGASSSGSANLTALSRVNLTATSGLRIHGTNNQARVVGGNSAAAGADASASSSGKATLNANNMVNLKGALVGVGAVNGWATVSGGYGAANGAEAHASYGAALVNVKSGVSLTATAGNLTVNAAKGVFVRGGGGAAAGRETGYGSTAGHISNGEGASNTSHFVQHNHRSTSYASATAKGTGATAKISGNANVSITDTGGILTLLQTAVGTGSVAVGGRGSAAASAYVDAQAGAAATVTGTGNVTLSAPNINMTGHKVSIFAGGDAVRGAPSAFSSSFVHTRHRLGYGSSNKSFHSHVTAQPKSDTAVGTGAKATVSGDTSVTVTTTGILNLQGSTGGVNIDGGYGAGSNLRAQASYGGLTSISAKQGVTITAAGGFVARAKNGTVGLEVGGRSAGYGAAFTANGSGAKTLVSTTSQLTLTAPTVSLTGLNVDVFGGSGNGYNEHVLAFNGGSAAVNLNDGVTITAATAFKASLSGSGSGGYGGGIFMGAGERNGKFVQVSGYGSGAKAAYTGNADLDITVTQTGGTITLAGNKQVGNIGIYGGTGDGQQAQATAESGATATVTMSETTNLTALGAISLTAKGDVGLNSSGFSIALNAGANASNGGTAKLTVTDNLNVTGGTVTLTATSYTANTTSHFTKGGDINISTDITRNPGSSRALLNGYGMHAGASSASASVIASNLLTVKATAGALSFNAANNLRIGGGSDSHESAAFDHAGAGGLHAVATTSWTAGDVFKGASVSMTAGDDLSITAASGAVDDSASAGLQGKATDTALSQIFITASNGAFTAKAGDEIEINGASGDAGYGGAHAEHPGAQASILANSTINISANNVALLAGYGVEIGGGDRAGSGARASASNGGRAAFGIKSGVSITAVNSFSMMLTGSNSSEGSLRVFGGRAAGVGAVAMVNGSNGGQATVNVNQDASVTVTGATGTLVISAGQHSRASLSIGAGASMGSAGCCGGGPRPGAQAFAGKGGTATINLSANANLSAKGAITLAAGSSSGSMKIGREFGDAGGQEMLASASYGGKATINLQDGTNLSGGAISLTAGDQITITAASGLPPFGGSSGGQFPMAHDIVHATFGGSANITGAMNTAITATGAFTADGGYGVIISQNAFNIPVLTAASGIVTASYGGAHANFTANNNIQITAASISLTGGEIVGISAGGFDNFFTRIAAASKNDVVTDTVNSNVTLSATGNISLSAGGYVFVDGGFETGYGAQVIAGSNGMFGGFGSSHGSFAHATQTTNANVSITAGKAFTATAGGELSIAADSGNGAGMRIVAFGPGNLATATVNTGVTIAASSMTLTGGSIRIAGGEENAISGSLLGIDLGQATLTNTGTVNLSATGNVGLTATSGDINIGGGGGDGASRAANIDAGYGGVAKLVNNSGVSVTAGGNLGMTATGNVIVSGGYGFFGLANAASAGSASISITGGVNLTAAKALNVTAGGSLIVHGATGNGLIADAFPSYGGPSSVAGPNGGTVKGTLNAAVSLSAGSNATLAAGGNVVIAAGSGATLTVGSPLVDGPSGSLFIGQVWGGGVANLSANQSATVSAAKNLTVTAGTAGAGSLQVLGMGPDREIAQVGPGSSSIVHFLNETMVRGGSSHAVANINVNGNALLTAGSNLTLNAKGNASIAGGAPAVVLALHTKGTVSVLTSADATLHAGKNVILNNIAGSLTLAGNNSGPSAGEMEVDTHADSGSAVAIGHADAAITAGGSIATVTNMGGGLNLLGGSFLLAEAHGSAQAQHVTATASATLTAGTKVNIVAGGGLNVLGGRFNQAVASVAGSFSDQSHTANLTAMAAITAGSLARVVVSGNGVIAGGDSVSAKAAISGSQNNVVFTKANVGATIQGTAVSLGVHGNLIVRGGFGNKVDTVTIGGDPSSGGNIASASINAAVGLVAKTGNLGINVGGSSAFLHGGSEGAASVTNLFFYNVAVANVHSDLTLSAGGNIGITAAGNLTVAGGAANQQFAEVATGGPSSFFGSALPAFFAKTTVNNTAAVKVTAVGSITVNQSGGNLNLLGGSDDAFFNFIAAGGVGNTIKENVDSSVLVKAGTTLTFNGAKNVTVAAGILPDGGSSGTSGTGPFFFNSASFTRVGVTVNSSVKLLGTAVTVNHTGSLSVTSFSSYTTSSGVTRNGGVSGIGGSAGVHGGLSGHAVKVGFGPLTQGLDVAPAGTQTSFGGVQPLSSLPTTSVSAPAAETSVSQTGSGLSVAAALQPLATLQSDSLVLSLVPVVGKADTASTAQAVTLFTPVTGAKSYSDSFAGACVALVVSRTGANCAGGK